MGVDRLDVEKWLDYLATDGSEGKIHLANIYGTISAKLLEVSSIVHIVEYCVGATSPNEAVSRFNMICSRSFGSSRIPNHEIESNDTYAVVVKMESFERYISSGVLTPRLSATAGNPLPLSKTQKILVRRNVERMSKTQTWAKTNATLGAPSIGGRRQICCWFTREEHIDAAVSPSTDPDKNATTVRDLLGLIHYENGDEIVLITFPATTITGNPAIEVAEPTFADCGNLRYAAVQTGVQYQQNRIARWGTTVNLDSFAKSLSDCCGAPERVSTAIPVDARHFQLKPGGGIIGTRGKEKDVDGDEEFASWLLTHFMPTQYSGMISQIAQEVGR